LIVGNGENLGRKEGGYKGKFLAIGAGGGMGGNFAIGGFAGVGRGILKKNRPEKKFVPKKFWRTKKTSQCRIISIMLSLGDRNYHCSEL
jgi:hypothetical protein